MDHLPNEKLHPEDTAQDMQRLRSIKKPPLFQWIMQELAVSSRLKKQVLAKLPNSASKFGAASQLAYFRFNLLLCQRYAAYEDLDIDLRLRLACVQVTKVGDNSYLLEERTASPRMPVKEFDGFTGNKGILDGFFGAYQTPMQLPFDPSLRQALQHLDSDLTSFSCWIEPYSTSDEDSERSMIQLENTMKAAVAALPPIYYWVISRIHTSQSVSKALVFWISLDLWQMRKFAHALNSLRFGGEWGGAASKRSLIWLKKSGIDRLKVDRMED